MQPHTGAIITVINYLAPSIKLVPESFEGQTFTVQSTIYSSSGSFLHYKYHLVRTIRYNQKARELETSYWIYFVPGIDRKTRSYHGEITKIPNPSCEVFETGKYSSNCTKYHVTEK